MDEFMFLTGYPFLGGSFCKYFIIASCFNAFHFITIYFKIWRTLSVNVPLYRPR